MTLVQWFIFFLVIQGVHGLGTWKLYIKAGRQAWEAFIPVYNAVVLLKIIKRHWSWVILLFLPIVNLIMFPVIWVETARSFGKNTRLDTLLAIITLGFYNYYLNYFVDVNYLENRSLHPRTGLGEWVSSILFAVVAATIVHTYFIQPYVIPTSSLEKSLLVGDFLFVSKMHFGARAPMTTIAAPMVHDTIPVIKTKSYLPKFAFPYFRFPAFQKIKHNDIVVFNWPVDTVQQFFKSPDKNYFKPIDKKSNYVKRCVGLPGDSLEVREGNVYINGKQNVLPDRAKPQFRYEVILREGRSFNNNILGLLKSRYDITDGIYATQDNRIIIPAASQQAVNMFKDHPSVAKLIKNTAIKGQRDPGVFPHHPDYKWNNDFFGPIYIPQTGKTIDINLEVLPLYKRVITEYEGNTLKVQGNQIVINGEITSTYTFKQDYYWMMGDNRNNSEDARTWGFVPFDHVVGKPVFKWMSWNTHGKGFDKVRWNRVFTTVGGSGEPVSYFVPFLVVLFAGIGFSKWRKRRKGR